jgi:hypothetical protein
VNAPRAIDQLADQINREAATPAKPNAQAIGVGRRFGATLTMTDGAGKRVQMSAPEMRSPTPRGNTEDRATIFVATRFRLRIPFATLVARLAEPAGSLS